ncbi:MAG: HDOD domain-containing protein [Gammaproteobacteria bacterium]|nr:HDOD domain-containing protein [Gammaproteobacteria bacterium]
MTPTSTPTKAELLAEVAGLASPPHTCTRVMALIHDERADVSAIGDVIAQDTSLATRLLRLVNSSFYNFPRQIDTLSRAIAIVGLNDLHTLVVAVSAVDAFSRLGNRQIDMESFWRHSLYTAMLSRELGRRGHYPLPERLFVTGLLHDVGLLMICNQLGDMEQGLIRDANGDEDTLQALERDTFGFDHGELGGEILGAWQLPATITGGVRYHHRPDVAGAHQGEASYIWVADLLAHQIQGAGLFRGITVELPGFQEELLATVGMTRGGIDLDGLIDKVNDEFAEVHSHIHPR